MRFLIDENVPLTLAPSLRQRGHDVVAIVEAAPTSEDPDVLQMARTQRRILVTFDRDFGRMIFYGGDAAPPGVVYMRSRPDEAAKAVDRFLGALDASIELVGWFIVIDLDGGVRVLPLYEEET